MAIDNDDQLERLLVQFLGDAGVYDKCCADAAAVDLRGASHGLTEGERLAIWIYTSTDADWFLKINSQLWAGSSSPAVSAITALLNGALAKLPFCDRIVYRGFGADDLDSFLAQFEDIGSVIRWPGFTSSTLVATKAFRKNILFTIRSATGRELGRYAAKPFDEEVLFPCGCRFQIISVDRREDVALIELLERT